jgi:hypothetical protein
VQTIDGDGWLRTDDYGVIEKLEHEQIVTSFYRVLVPIWPEHSAYVIRAIDGSEQRIKIPLQKKSVLLGYLRFPSWLMVMFFGAPALLAAERWAWLGVLAAAFLLVAVTATFFAGRLAEDEVLRRSLLRRVVGFGAPPELLSDALRAEVRSNLELMWNTKSDTAWPDAIDAGEASELLVALAEYDQDPELLAVAHANFANKQWN